MGSLFEPPPTQSCALNTKAKVHSHTSSFAASSSSRSSVSSFYSTDSNDETVSYPFEALFAHDEKDKEQKYNLKFPYLDFVKTEPDDEGTTSAFAFPTSLNEYIQTSAADAQSHVVDPLQLFQLNSVPVSSQYNIDPRTSATKDRTGTMSTNKKFTGAKQTNLKETSKSKTKINKGTTNQTEHFTKFELEEFLFPFTSQDQATTTTQSQMQGLDFCPQLPTDSQRQFMYYSNPYSYAPAPAQQRASTGTTAYNNLHLNSQSVTPSSTNKTAAVTHNQYFSSLSQGQGAQLQPQSYQTYDAHNLQRQALQQHLQQQQLQQQQQQYLEAQQDREEPSPRVSRRSSNSTSTTSLSHDLEFNEFGAGVNSNFGNMNYTSKRKRIGGVAADGDSDNGPYGSGSASIEKERRGSKRAKKQAMAEATPGFMVAQLHSARGTGEFTSPELLITLFFAHRYFLQSNTYSKVRSCMNFTRSRASIRRKIEKIVGQEIGCNGGLLLSDELRQRCKDVLLTRFWKLLEEIRATGNDMDRKFADDMQQFVLENGTSETNVNEQSDQLVFSGQSELELGGNNDIDIKPDTETFS